jgi:hypothetical protein
MLRNACYERTSRLIPVAISRTSVVSQVSRGQKEKERVIREFIIEAQVALVCGEEQSKRERERVKARVRVIEPDESQFQYVAKNGERGFFSRC